MKILKKRYSTSEFVDVFIAILLLLVSELYLFFAQRGQAKPSSCWYRGRSVEEILWNRRKPGAEVCALHIRFALSLLFPLSITSAHFISFCHSLTSRLIFTLNLINLVSLLHISPSLPRSLSELMLGASDYSFPAWMWLVQLDKICTVI